MSKYTAEQVLYAAQLEEDTYDGDLIIVQYLRDYAALLRERESASTRVPDSEWLELADVLDKFTPTGGPGPLWGAGASFAYSDAAKTIRAKLAAAPKPETE